jgi:hypothetical protein
MLSGAWLVEGLRALWILMLMLPRTPLRNDVYSSHVESRASRFEILLI